MHPPVPAVHPARGARWRRLSSLTLALSSALLAVSPDAHADRDIGLLMNMDHHLVDADFIGVIEVDTAALFTDVSGLPMQAITADVADIVASRWSAEPSISLVTDAGFDHLTVGSKYLVLMSGGPWHHGPFTHRENSVFEVLPTGELACSGGDLLYGVMHDGFYCAPAGTVEGAPVLLPDVLARIPCLRDRAVARLPELAAELDKDPRKLELEPTQLDKLEVRR
ncbi:MAG: hypothetical protein JNK45_17600 [Myxococcales bacterium]|nr:hypothetical protein [Myxococcales bacterium]